MTLTVGDVFLWRNYGRSGTDPHYHIVVHKTTANEVVLVYTTTNLQAAYKAARRDEADLPDHAEPISYVEIPAGVCTALPILCAVDCNKAHLKSEAECLAAPDFKLQNGKVDMSIIVKIRAGIEESGTVLPNVIKIIKALK